MMDRKIILIGLILILIGSTFAYTIGQTITQTQFDKQDFTTHNLGMKISNVYKTNDRVFVEFTYDTLRKEIDENTGVETGDWVITQLTGRIPYYIGYYRECRDTNTIQECKIDMRKFVVNKAKSFRQTERTWLEEQKTKVSDEIVISDFTNLEINLD